MNYIYNDIQVSLINEYEKLYKNKAENLDRLTLISIHLLYFRLLKYNKLKTDFMLREDLKDEIYKTIKDIENIAIDKDYIDDFLLLHKKFKNLLDELNDFKW